MTHKPFFRRTIAICALAALAAPGLAPALTVPGMGGAALAQSRDGQRDARREMSAGNVLPLRQIERSVVPRMKGAHYLGPEFDGAAMIYRLKFVEDGGRVVIVEVDARNGRTIRTRR